MDYNLTDKQKAVISWMVEANRRGELDDEFSVAWFLGSRGGVILGQSGEEQSEGGPEITQGVLDALESEGLLRQEIRYQTRTRRSGTTKKPRVTETPSERSRKCTLTKKAYDAVDSSFMLPDPQPTSASFHFHGDVNQSIIGTQNRAELTNNLDLRAVEQRIDQDGGVDAEELREALAEVRRLLESGDRIDRGALSRFSETMQRHEWFTGSVMQALLGFATQAGG